MTKHIIDKVKEGKGKVKFNMRSKLLGGTGNSEELWGIRFLFSSISADKNKRKSRKEKKENKRNRK